MSEWYTIKSFVTNSSHPSENLSAYFETPGKAQTFRKNVRWRLTETGFNVEYWTGTNTVQPDGELTQGGAPGNFVFTSPYEYDGFMELQVQYEPEPTSQCECSCPPNPSGAKTCPAGTQVGESVQLPSGRFVHNIPLMSISAIGNGGWQFGLDYYANFGLDSIVGKNFNFQQSSQLVELATVDFLNDVELVTSQNTRELFINTAPNEYSSEDNNTASILTRAGAGVDDEFTLTASNGTISKFFGFDDLIATPGRLKSITDRFGNEQSYAWVNTDGVDQLVAVTDSYGRSIQYRYYGSEVDYRLQEIEDFLGRKLNFQFDELGHLIAVVTPSVTQAAPENQFPGGTAYVFQYDTENVEPERQDDLIKIWYPNEVAPYLDAVTRTVNVAGVYNNATPRYIAEYGQDSGEDSWGRVVAETLGDPGEEIGGTATFEYTTTGLPSNLIDPSDTIVMRCTMTDRNGNVTIHDFNAADMEVRHEIERNRDKLDVPDIGTFPSYVTWTKYNEHNRPLEIVYPEGNTVEYEYEAGTVSGIGDYPRREGLLLRTTRKPGNTLSTVRSINVGFESDI